MSTAPAQPSAFGERPVLTQAAAAESMLASADVSRLWALSDTELAESMGRLERVRAITEAQQVAVMAESLRRGLGAEQGWSQVDWATRSAPGMTATHAARLNTLALAGQDGRLKDVTDAAITGEVSVPKAAQIARFHSEVKGLADPSELAEITGHLLAGASGPKGLTERQLKVAIARTGHLLKPDRDIEHIDEVRRSHRALYKSKGPAGMSSYRILLDPEGAAILDAAIDPLAAPAKDPDTGEPDPRPMATRRADALLTIIGRGVGSPGKAPKTAKTALVVTIDYERLVGQLRGSGITLGQEALSPATVRRLACEADLIPIVLGTKGEALDVGRRKRLVPPAIRLAAWLRDGGCTYPDCTVPAQWCDAHHGVPWYRGGKTSILNTALLCQRHHTLVHKLDLNCTITDTGVTWHL